MADESLRFDIIGRDNASGAFSRVAASVKDMGDRMDVATRHALVMDEALKRQSTAARTSAEATLAAAKADKILADAEEVLSGRAIEAELALKREAAAARDAGRESKTASGGFSALAGGGGIPGGGIGAAIAAGTLLSPVLVTVGTGLAGFGAAAYGVIKPIENAAQKTGGLQANLKMLDPEQRAVAKSILALGNQYAAFQKELKPEVFSVLGRGIQLASHLMGDLEPVAAATGKALGGLIGQVDAEFRSNNWQNFFAFMAKTAGPDIHLLGNAFVSLTQDLPPLLEALQPVATTLLKVIAYTGDAIRAAELASTNFQDLGKSSQQSAHGFNAFTEGTKAAIPGMEYVSRLGKEIGQGLDILYGNSGKAASGTRFLAFQQRSETQVVKAQVDAFNKLNSAVTTHIAKVLTLEGDEVSWKQAQQAATQAINQNKHALDGNSASALTARAAIIQSTSSVIKFADENNTSTAALQRGSNAIQNQIAWLEKHAGKSKIARDEVALLIQEEDKIQRQINSRILVSGSGSWRMTSSTNPYPGGISGRAASGMFISQGNGPTADDVLIRASRGELVVPANMVSAGAVDHLRGRIPGFAAGGIIPSYNGGVAGLPPWLHSNMVATNRSIITDIANSFAHNFLPPVIGGGGGPTSADAAAAQRYAASLLGAYGWGSSQMSPLIALWNRESGWNRFARNPSSGAYGIPQALPPSKMGAAANPPLSSAAAQIQWGLSYIAGRYGSPSGAWGHEMAFGWYDQGGYLPPGMSLAYNGTGRPERVGGGGNVYITVNVPPTVNPREVGRQVSDVLKAHIKAGGTLYPAGVTPR